METEKRRAFIIDFMYFAILALLCFAVLKYAMPLLAPFIIGFALAYLLKGPIRLLSGKLRLNGKISAIVVVLVFYGTIGTVSYTHLDVYKRQGLWFGLCCFHRSAAHLCLYP